jgi:hypothetical protein
MTVSDCDDPQAVPVIFPARLFAARLPAIQLERGVLAA